MKQYVNEDILRFYLEYGGQAASLLGIVSQNCFTQAQRYDNVTRYYQRTISQNSNMEPLQTLWDEIQRFEKSCYSPAMFDLLPEFFKHFFIGVWIELLTNTDYWGTNAEFNLGSMVFDVDVYLWLNPSRPDMDPSCVTISRPIPPLQFNSKQRCAMHIVQYYRGTSSYWDREHTFPSDHYELLLVNTNAGPQRREVYLNPNFQNSRIIGRESTRAWIILIQYPAIRIW
jgi:hypothetical protein